MNHPQQLQYSSGQIEVIKILAFLTMFIDHYNLVFLHRESIWMFMLGRFSFVGFAFIVAYNLLHHVRSKLNYIRRLAALALISQPFYYFAFGWPIFFLNIFFTFVFAIGIVLAIEKAQESNNEWIKWYVYLFFVPMTLLLSIFVSYMPVGVLFVVTLYYFLKNGGTWYLLVLPFLLMLNINDQPGPMEATLLSALFIYLFRKVSIPTFRLNRYMYYALYPLHLLIIALIK